MWFDLVVLAILAYATLRGAAKGIVWQLAVIASLLLCFVFSGSLSLALAPLIKVDPPLNRWIAMFVLYVGFSFLSFGAARGLRSWIEQAKFVEYDRHLGAIFGFIKGVTISLVLIFFTVTLSASMREPIMNSYSGHAAAVIMDRLHPVMPAGLQAIIEPYIHQLDRPGMDLQHAHDHDHGPDLMAPPFGDPLAPGFEGPRDPEPPWQRDPAPVTDGGWFGSGNEWDWEKQLPQSLQGDLRRLALQALQNTAPADRAELLNQLSSGIPAAVQAVALAWQDGKPTAPPSRSLDEARYSLPREWEEPGTVPPRPVTESREPRTVPPLADGRIDEQSYLQDIAAAYTDDSGDQLRFLDEHERLLSGLPKRVEQAVLRDWHADLLSLDREVDPDPETTFQTSLESRIIRQLSYARVPVSSLSSDLQSRFARRADTIIVTRPNTSAGRTDLHRQ